MVVERYNALVFLMISSLELKVEGSNPAISVLFEREIVGLEWNFAIFCKFATSPSDDIMRAQHDVMG